MAKLTEGKMKVIQGLLEEYDIETAEDIQNALKDLLGGTIQMGQLILLRKTATLPPSSSAVRRKLRFLKIEIAISSQRL